MRTETITLYKFDELPSEHAKEKARYWWRSTADYPWWGEAKESIEAFCKLFGVELVDYEVSTHRPYYFKTDAANRHFRGVKLKKFDMLHSPTGYCLDYTLCYTFHKTFRDTGDAKHAFNEALDAAFKDIVNDMEWLDSDEAIDETLIANEYEFTIDGTIY